MDPDEIIRHNGGSARWHELRQHVSQRQLEAALKSGDIFRAGRGVYLPGRFGSSDLAHRLGGVVSHYSAAYIKSLGTFGKPSMIDITIDRRRTRVRAPSRVRLHYGQLTDDDVDGGYTTPLRTVVDCVRTYDLPVALPIAECAIRKGRVEIAELEETVARLRGPGCARARKTVALIDMRSQSPMESLLRALLVQAGITCFEPQFAVEVDGVKYHADLGDPVTKTLIEADSFMWHGDRAAFAHDCRRYSDFVAKGYVVLRFAYEHVTLSPEWVVQAVRQTLDQRVCVKNCRHDS